MGTFFVYILKSALCVALFYLFYRLLLSRDTFHRFNRFALLALLLFSCLLPLAEVSVRQPSGLTERMLTLEEWIALADALSAADRPAMEAVESGWAGVPVVQWMLLVYLAGILFFVLRHLCSLGRMLLLLRSGRCEPLPAALFVDGVRLIVHGRPIAPFSWMRYIVIGRKDLEENGREILIHELAHIRCRHSWDLLLADVCIFFQWFNPAAWLLKQELQNIHEYEADEHVIRAGVNAKEYQLLLIKKAVGTRLYSMANSFNHSKLKKRITMMLKEKSSPWARLKYLYVLPVAAVTLSAFARPEVVETSEEISAVKVNDLVSIMETSVTESLEKRLSGEPARVEVLPQDTVWKRSHKDAVHGLVYDVCDKQPEFPGGQQELMKFMAKNVRYPEAAHKDGVQGRVIVRFVVDKEGNVCQPEVMRSVHELLDAEAIRVISAMPRWTPGIQDGQAVATYFVMPVMFRLSDDAAAVSSPDSTRAGNGSLHATFSWDKTPALVLINGKEIDKSILSAINPDKIKSIEVLKGDSAVKAYGERAKAGVILVTLKGGTENRVADNAASSAGGNQVGGVVKDVHGNPVVGAIVVVEGSKRGTVTGPDGRFSIAVADGDKLKGSFVGMRTTVVELKDKKGTIDVVLKKE